MLCEFFVVDTHDILFYEKLIVNNCFYEPLRLSFDNNHTIFGPTSCNCIHSYIICGKRISNFYCIMNLF